eukprot:CAMPEP_0194160656 /NCGR_PEP_ID=MMETSP0152-20130528/78509_1 /TAXON_ID=1049557 /ORGANISM="Thalassiothrix antarctica, Strain L6-D1" /LENGTH=1402 /DNA_ID=CAMNT_0038870365 /DNA_START=60 /DNA_END=4265 /DNA_ORIENTATION=-
MSNSSENKHSSNHVVSGVDIASDSKNPLPSLLVESSQKHLRIIDFTQIFARHFHYFLPGTRVSHLKNISDWINSSSNNLENNQGNTVFWLTGDAGTGKSIISAKVLHINYNDSLIGWHFCQHSNPLENTSIAILESMSGIIASRLPAYKTAVTDVEEKALEAAKSKDDSMEFYRLLFETPLNNIEQPTDNNGIKCQKLMIIDALDEIQDKQLDKFLKVLTCFSELPPWIRLFVTSRRYDKILKSLSVKHKPVELRVDAAEQQNDVQIFLYSLARKFADRDFKWGDLGREIENKFNLPSDSIEGKLEQLQDSLVSSRKTYEVVIQKMKNIDPDYDELVKNFPMKKANQIELKQHTNVLNTIMEQAEIAQELLGNEIKRIWGDAAVIPSIKRRVVAEQKMMDKYNGNAEYLRDISRFTGKFETFKELNNAYESLLTIDDLTVINIKNKFLDPDVLGYVDINLNVEYNLPGDLVHICEVQLHLSSILVVKEAVHIHYEKIRVTIPRIVKNISPELSKQIQAFAIGRLRSSKVEAALATLVEKSGGVFLHARLLKEQMEAMETQQPGWKFDFKELQALSSSVYSHYEENLDRILPKEASNELRDEGVKYMALVCAAAEPLLTTSMERIIGEDYFERVKEKLSLLFPTDSSGRITITHKSVVDFLTGDDGEVLKDESKKRVCMITPKMMKSAHTKICQHCFEVVRIVGGDEGNTKKLSATNSEDSSNDNELSTNTETTFKENDDNKRHLSNTALLVKNTHTERIDAYALKHPVLHACNGEEIETILKENDDNKRHLSNTTLLVNNTHMERMNTYALKHTVLHACNGEDDMQVQRVRDDCILNFTWQFQKLQLFGYVAIRNDFDVYLKSRTDRAATLIFHAFKLSLTAIIQNALLLPSQLVGGRLTLEYEKETFPEIDRFREDARSWLVDGGSVAGSTTKDCKNVVRWIPVSQALVPAGHPCLTVFGGHEGDVNSLRLDSSGEYIYSGGRDGTVRKWEIQSGECCLVMRGHKEDVICVDVTADGLAVFSGGVDETIKKWDAETGIELLSLVGHEKNESDYGDVKCVRISLDGQMVCSGGSDKTVRLWNGVTGALSQVMRGHSDEVFGVALNADASLVYSCGDKSIREWDTASGECIRTLLGHTEISIICLSVNEKHLYSDSFDNTVGVWDLKEGSLVRQMEGHTDDVNSVCELPDGNILSVSTDKTIKKWNPITGKCVNTLEGHSYDVSSVDANSSIICSGSFDGTVRVWDATVKATESKVLGHSQLVWWVQYNQKGDTLLSFAANMYDEDINPMYCVWNCATGSLLHMSEDEPPKKFFKTSTARKQYVAYEFGDTWEGDGTVFDESDISFSGDSLFHGDVHFFEDDTGHKVSACYVDGTKIHFLQIADTATASENSKWWRCCSRMRN